ncbi:hypothetical protein, partial [Fervidobacterium sp.]
MDLKETEYEKAITEITNNIRNTIRLDLFRTNDFLPPIKLETQLTPIKILPHLKKKKTGRTIALTSFDRNLIFLNI